jgi:WD40 repeat protein
VAQVFISYSRKDKEFVQKLVAALVAEKREVWLDETNIEPTAEWLKEIFDNIEAADNFVFVISPDSVISTYARKEIDHAALNNKRIVPILYQAVPDKDIPEAVAKFQRIDFTGGDGFDPRFAKLITSLDTDLDWKQAHTRLLTRAKEWEPRKDSSFLLRGKDLREAEQWVAKSAEKEPKPTALHSQYILASRQSATKTQRIIIGAVALAFLIAVGVVIYALREQRVAVRNAARATEQERIAKTNEAKATEQEGIAKANAKEAEEQRKAAVTSAEETSREKDIAVEKEGEAKLQQGIAQENAAKANHTRIVNTWESAARTASRDITNHEDDDRSALLARQALLLHQQLTPDEPQYLVEQALQDVAMTTSFVHVFPVQATEAVALAADGNHLAATGYPGIHVWDLRDGKQPPLILPAHEGSDTSIAFSPDSSRLVSGSNDDKVRVWNLQQPSAPELVFSGPNGVVDSVAFAPSGKQLASAGYDHTIRLWDLRRPNAPPQVLLHPDIVSSVAFAPDGRSLVSGCWDGKVRLWDLQKPGTSSEFSASNGGVVSAVAIAPKGRQRVVAASGDKILMWNLDSLGHPPEVLSGHEGNVYSLSFSADGQYLASAGGDRTIRIWDLRWPVGLSHPTVLRGHRDLISAVAFAPNGKRLASASKDFTVRVWDLRQSEDSSQLLSGKGSGWVTGVAFSKDAQWFAASGWDKTVRVWNLHQLSAPPLVLYGHQDKVTSVSFARDGNHLASSSEDRSVRVWDVRQPSVPPLVFSGHREKVYSVAFAPDGNLLVSGSYDGTARVWDLRQPQTSPLVFSGSPYSSIRSVAFTSDSSRIVAADGHVVREWNLQHPDAVPSAFPGLQTQINAVAVSASRLASAGDDWSLMMWDLSRPDLPGRVFRYEDSVTAVAFSHDGNRMASTSGKTVRIRDLRKPEAAPVVLREADAQLDAVAFAPDDNQIAWAGVGNIVRLWPLWSKMADYLCTIVWRNLSLEEWQLYIGKDTPYDCTCSNLPPGGGAPSGAHCPK